MWRLYLDTFDVNKLYETVLEGPSEEAIVSGFHATVQETGEMVMDDEMTEADIGVICGEYKPFACKCNKCKAATHTLIIYSAN